MEFAANRYDLVEVARGDRPADFFLAGGTVVNVYSGELLQQNVALYRDRIAYVGNRKTSIGPKTKVLNVEGKYLVPGYIETHGHPWVFYNPVSLTEAILPLGTTTIVNDNLFFYLYMGLSGFKKMVVDLKTLPMNHFWLARIVSQSDYPGERKWFHPENIRDLLQLDQVIGTAEVTRWPLLYQGDPFVIETVDFARSIGKISDGHTAGASYDKLNAIVASGINACHEAISSQESLDRLRLGMWTTLRNSSLRPDLTKLIKMITEQGVDTRRVLLTTDGPHPGFIKEEGFVDGLLRKAVRGGIHPVQAIQMVTINAATYLKLDGYLGGISPGLKADIGILSDLNTFRPETVISGGKIVAKNGKFLGKLPEIQWEQYIVKKSFSIPFSVLNRLELYRYPASEDRDTVPVISFKIAVITKRKEMDLPKRDGFVDISDYPQLAYATLIDREGRWVSRGILENFTKTLEGMASTYNTTTELLAIGRNPAAMAMAARRVREIGGGIVIVENGKIVLEIPLPITGMMMADCDFNSSVEYHEKLITCLRGSSPKFCVKTTFDRMS